MSWVPDASNHLQDEAVIDELGIAGNNTTRFQQTIECQAMPRDLAHASHDQASQPTGLRPLRGVQQFSGLLIQAS